MKPADESRGLVAAVIGDGIPLLLMTAAGLAFSGGLAIFLAASGQFLPHDLAYLGMSARELCAVDQCRIVEFMIHDRASFGGALFAIGVLYAYLALFPLRSGEAWAWWLFLISGSLGFATFLAYLTYGYLDTWHGIGTLLLLPLFVGGIVRTRRLVGPWRGPLVMVTGDRLPDRTWAGLGRACLLAGASGTAIGGLTIFGIGLTDIFVPEDLEYMRMSTVDLRAVNPHLVPLIAHDRAGFGGAVMTLGLIAVVILWCTPMTRALWQAMLIGGGVALAAATGIHFVVDYTDLWHLTPVLAATLSMATGLALSRTALRSTDQKAATRLYNGTKAW
jgi:hypothetical protein